MNFRNISAWSIRNPVVPLVLFAALLLAGIMSFMRMDVQDNPDIEFPAVDIRIAQPGAAPTEIETQITQHVESAVRSLNNVASISSNANEGSSSTTVQFEIGQEPDQAVMDVKNAIDQIRGSLPDGILEPQIVKQETSSEPIAFFAVGATDMTLEQSHHLGPELGEFRSFAFPDYKVDVRFEGPVAIATETYRYRIVPKTGDPIDRQGVATSVLKKIGGNWKIITMHNSGRRPKGS